MQLYRRTSQKIDKKKRSNKIALHFDPIPIHIRIQFSIVERAHLTRELLTPFALPASIAVLAFSCITLASRHTTTPLSKASKKLSPDTISESETWKKRRGGKKKTIVSLSPHECKFLLFFSWLSKHVPAERRINLRVCSTVLRKRSLESSQEHRRSGVIVGNNGAIPLLVLRSRILFDETRVNSLRFVAEFIAYRFSREEF